MLYSIEVVSLVTLVYDGFIYLLWRFISVIVAFCNRGRHQEHKTANKHCKVAYSRSSLHDNKNIQILCL